MGRATPIGPWETQARPWGDGQRGFAERRDIDHGGNGRCDIHNASSGDFECLRPLIRREMSLNQRGVFVRNG